MNDDLEINLEEAMDHLGRAKTGVMRFMHRFVTPVWFAKIDTDHDGKISPSEFDSQLSHEALQKFNRFFYNTHE